MQGSNSFQQSIVRLMNAMASIKSGRDYLGYCGKVVSVLINSLVQVSKNLDQFTIDMIVATLQKLSLKWVWSFYLIILLILLVYLQYNNYKIFFVYDMLQQIKFFCPHSLHGLPRNGFSQNFWAIFNLSSSPYSHYCPIAHSYFE